MATVTGLTKDRMLQIEGNSIVSGYVDSNNHLQLVQFDGDVIDAGLIKSFMPTGQQITDWNAAVDPGYYWSYTGGTLNAPSAAWWLGVVQTFGTGTNVRIVQTLIDPTGVSRISYRRVYSATTSSWGSWASTTPTWVDRGYATADQIKVDPGNLFYSPWLQFGSDGTGVSGSTNYTGSDLSPTGSRAIEISSRDHIGNYLFSVDPNEEFLVDVVAKQVAGTAAFTPALAFYDGNGNVPANSNWYEHTPILGATKKVADYGNGWGRYTFATRSVGDRSIAKAKLWIQIGQAASGGGTTWRISDIIVRKLERGRDAGWVPLVRTGNGQTTGWLEYAVNNRDTNFIVNCGAYKLSSGLIILSGLLAAIGSSVTAGEVIGTLPPGFAPEYNTIIGVDYGNTQRGMTIQTDGTIRARSGWSANQYLSLDGIAYWGKHSDAKWTDIGSGGTSYGSSVGAFSDPQYGSPAVYKDAWGMTWFRGLLNINTAISVDNTRLINLPDSYRGIKQQHFAGCGMDAYAGFGTAGSALGTQDGLNWKPNSPTAVGNWISLSGIKINTADSETLIEWRNPRYLDNGWANYPGNFYTLGFGIRGDGLNVARGMMMSPATVNGTGITFCNVWPDLVPKNKERIILPAIANNVHARIDVFGEQAGGIPNAFAGANGAGSNWWAVDNLMWKTRY